MEEQLLVILAAVHFKLLFIALMQVFYMLLLLT